MTPSKSAPLFFAVVMPAYNEADHIAEVIDRILEVTCDEPWELIVVNDGSTDGTADVLASFGNRIRVETHPTNYGYGASLKTGIRATMAQNVIFIDADGQHDPAHIPKIVEHLHRHDFVIGMRRRQQGVPMIRLPGKLILKLVVSFLAGNKIHDVNYGFRGGRRDLYLRMLDLLPDGFSFSTTSLVFAIKSRFLISYLELPSNVRKGFSTVRMVRDGMGTLLLATRLVMLFDPIRAFAVPALTLIGIGIVYQTLILIYVGVRLVNGAVFAMLAGIILFHFALLADQIASLRKEISALAGLQETLRELESQTKTREESEA